MNSYQEVTLDIIYLWKQCYALDLFSLFTNLLLWKIIDRIVTAGNNYEGSDAISVMDKNKKRRN